MYRLMLALCLATAACAPRTVGFDGQYRAASAPIYSNAAFDMGRLEGSWTQVADFSAASCGPGAAEFLRKKDKLQVNYRLCLSGQTVSGAGPVVATGPGRFKVAGFDGAGQDWWVLWVDEGYRTMAIGNPAGTFGFILNRGKSLPTDRLVAAREVFDFNGYDTEKLRVFAQ